MWRLPPAERPVRSRSGARRWRALDLGVIPTYIEAEVPRVRCKDHGVVVCSVPWARRHRGGRGTSAPNMRTGTNQSTDIGRTETIAAQAQRAHPGDTRPPHQAVYRKGWFARPCRLPPPRTPDQLRARWTVKDRLIT